MSFYTSHATQTYWNLKVPAEHYFVFGCESKGLPSTLIQNHAVDSYAIPLQPNSIRSFNLANAVSIVLFEGLRQQSL